MKRAERNSEVKKDKEKVIDAYKEICKNIYLISKKRESTVISSRKMRSQQLQLILTSGITRAE